MSKPHKQNNHNSDLHSEYDFAHMKGGIRGKYVKSLREQSNIVVLEPDIRPSRN